MTPETDDFLDGLYGYDEHADGGPYVDWTKGFEATPEEVADYAENTADTSEDAAPSGGWGAWER